MEQHTNPGYVGNQPHDSYSPTGDERVMAILSHILALVAPILAPLIIYLFKKDESKYVAAHAIESLNFQITMVIIGIACFFLIFVVVGAFLLPLVGIVSFVLVIIATIKASDNKLYRYPINFRLIKLGV